MKKYLFIASLAFFLFSACKKETETPQSPTFDYFPTDYGRFVSYQVDSIVHETDDLNNDDSVTYYHFQLMDVIDSSFADLEGKTRQVVLRYYSNDNGATWTLRDVWSQLLTSSAAYRYEDNIAYHKLAFPISSSKTWNGNDKNILGEEDYSYSDIHISQSVNGMSFDSTLVVQQANDDNFVNRTYGKEIYAENVGMIFKQRDDLVKNSGFVASGTEYKMTLLDYGPK